MNKLRLIIFSIALLSLSSLAQKQIFFEQVGLFNEGLAPVLLDNKWGFIDTEGNVVIEPKFVAFLTNFSELPYFSEGLTPIVDPETERVGFIDKKGNIVIKPKFYSAKNFSEDVAFAGTQEDYVIIDKSGNIIAQKFVALNGFYSSFSHNRAIVQKEFSYGYIDKQGKFVIKPVYDEARDFSNGLAAVKKDGKWGFIDIDGNVKVQFQFSNEPKPFSDNRAFVQGTNLKWGFIDTEGKIIVEPMYDQVFPFASGAAVVSKMDEKWNNTFYIIDVFGKSIKTFSKSAKSNETITLWSGFNEGLAVVMKDFKKGLMDPKGNIIVACKYRELKPLSSGMAYFEKYDDKTRKVTKGFINKSGKEVFTIEPPKF